LIFQALILITFNQPLSQHHLNHGGMVKVLDMTIRMQGQRNHRGMAATD
jgi:hypothetical protein